ncbi:MULTISPECIES: glucose-6-phosphate dehydrogenase [unclassified Thalassotalea]|uniref:glucose-6-phosphate dehydrogenase n=1 Tax=unclassified Thalassotalea TaxID=2614972 RepID=UPI001081DA6E|nr:MULTISPECIES: glucose-6-phosphate dehydrogenase [unclassified Thalassotalea]NMP15286.1 glucose-6-phosphate dehydrogenase [Thalassotalea sp. Y01]QBY06066.1 glucose-6-phosphate dehydrogenase [Thalassotalea sp. HSM 43]
MTQSNVMSAEQIVLFGAAGDLSKRKLFAALYHLYKEGLLVDNVNIIGVARLDMNDAGFQDFVKENLNTFIGDQLDAEVVDKFITHFSYAKLDFADTNGYKELANVIRDNKYVLYYLATPPSIYGLIADGLEAQGLNNEYARVVMEKPIGHDLDSSKVINDLVSRHFEEPQIYRIDHYLGKETVLNLISLRFANSLFSTNWDHNCIDHVQITVAESVGIEGRWGFYDNTGQMRDMVQNHLLQILSLLAMEPPTDLSSESIRDEKLKVIKALRKIDRSNVHEKTVRGQYTKGHLNGVPKPGYLEEEGANVNSKTESFVAIKAEIDNWRWAGVPFYLRTGKRMPCKHSEVVIYFKHQPHNIFGSSFGQLPPNKLTIRLQPDEGVELTVMNKVPGITNEMEIREAKLDLSFSDFNDESRVVDAYERLVLSAINGNSGLFIRRDEVEASWQWVDSIMDAWNSSNDAPKGYAAGSWGPVSSIALIARDDRNWDE